MDIVKVDRSALIIGAACALLAGCGGSHLPGASSPGAAVSFARKHSATFQYTGAEQTFAVPAGVTHIRVVAIGGNGGGTPVAYAGRVSAVIPVKPSETLAVFVGGAGTSSAPGFNGGGAGGATGYSNTDGNGGGGASDVREGGDALTDRVVVAGGAGGRGAGDGVVGRYGVGGRGGALTGASGKSGIDGNTGNGRRAHLNGLGGTGGTRGQGGSGGKGDESSGQSAVLGSGGGGGSGCVTSSGTCFPAGPGGGGGGGFYGGGGGGAGIFAGCCGSGGGGGGGGGSSFAEKTAFDVHMWRGWKHGQGAMVAIFWR